MNTLVLACGWSVFAVVGTAYKAIYKYYSVSKEAHCGLMPACFRKNIRSSSDLSDRTNRVFPARKKESRRGQKVRAAARPRFGRFVKPRRAFAGGSPATAIERRWTGDRRSTVLVAWESHGECHAIRETTSRPPPRPPPQDDTLALASSRPTRRLGGGPARPASGRDVAPAPCAVASRRRSGSIRPARSRSPARVPCLPCERASGVSVPAGTADAYARFTLTQQRRSAVTLE